MSRLPLNSPALSAADALWRLHAMDERERTGHAPSPKLRADLASQVGARILQRYSYLREVKPQPVVQLDGGRCPACSKTYARSHPYAALEGSGEVHGCHTCGRLIAFLEPAPFASVDVEE